MAEPGVEAGGNLIFIVGMPRSGTTLLDRILAAHSRVTSIGECHLMPAIADDVDGFANGGTPLGARLAAAADTLRKRYLDGTGVGIGAGRKIVDKLPLNFWNVGLIRYLFPAATIVYARRNPLDIAVSSLRLRFPETFRYVNDLDDFAHFYLQHRRLMRFWRQRFGDAIEEFEYERLVADFESQARRLVRTCGLVWEPACLEFHRHAGTVHTLSMGQVHRRLYSAASGRWKPYRHRLKPLIEALSQAGEPVPAEP